MAEPDEESKGSRSTRVLKVIEAVVAAGQPMSVTEIGEVTGLPRASLHRIVGLLEREGYLQSGPRGRGLEQGARLTRLARSALAATSERGFRHSVLAALSREIGETCNISVPDGDAMVYLDRVETEWPLRHRLPIGTRVPLHCTAGGKLYLSRLTEANLERLLAVLPLKRHTERTITGPEALLDNLAAIRRESVGTDDEEFIEGMVAVAVPIIDAEGRMVAALAFHAPKVRMDLGAARNALPRLRAAARALSDSPEC